MYDLIIIGSGPAGLTAALYAGRAKMNTLVIEKSGMSGGQVLTTYEVDNYPALPGINGFDLGMKMREHVDKFEVEFIEADVLEILSEVKTKKIKTSQGEYEGKAIIIASGAVHAKLSVPGEERLAGMGVSYCATCDGAFFKEKTTMVVGGGDVAVEDAVFLSRFCKKVYLVHRRNQLRAAKILQDNLKKCNNIEVIWDSVVLNIEGKEQVEYAIIENTKNGKKDRIDIQGIFIAVGINPNSSPFASLLEMNERGYIIADETCATNIPGIYAAGDVREKQLRQIVTAVADGANAITSIQEYFMQE